MDVADKEFLRLLNLFEKHQVLYLVVGGFAVNRYGYNRATGDVDIFLKDSLENRKSLIAALEEMGYGDMHLLMDMPIIAGYCEVMMDSGVYLDLMTDIPGLEKDKFDEYFNVANVETIEGTTVRFIHINHLIANKIATGRPKDLQDVEELKKIRTGG